MEIEPKNCMFCGMKYEDHVDGYDEESALPKAPCHLLRSGFKIRTTVSPVPVLSEPVEKKISFPEAIRAVIDGKKITKFEWKSINIYGVLRDGFLMLHKEDDVFYQWIVSEEDLTGDDWIVL